MAIKVNEFVIQAKIIEDDNYENDSLTDDESSSIPDSVKQEIIDECVIKMKELLEREKSRY